MSIAKTTKITATSRSAVKIRDNYYTIELSEERTLPSDIELSDDELTREKRDLFDSVNMEVDRQIEDIVNTFRNK